jgi:lipopolysaccharide transport system ATP-binding protein
MSDIAIKVENLSKCYQIFDTPRDRLKQFIAPRIQSALGIPEKQYFKEFWALRDVSFEVRKGESVGILGRNGSGKSTLLQMITGTLAPTSGSVQTNGRVAALLELGSGFNPEFTGRDNVYMNGALLGLSPSEINNRFDAIASFADIGDFIDQPVKTYSSGMLVRLAFAVQVQVEPDILIVDEALAVGDALFQKRCFQRIEKLISDGVALLFVSHDIESIRTLTHKSLLLRGGIPYRLGVSSDVVLEYRKLLHEEESKYFSQVTKLIAQKGNSSVLMEDMPKDAGIKENSQNPENQLRSDKLSFGEGGAEVVSVETLNNDGNECNIFYPGEKIKIRITCCSRIEINHLNVGLRIRNKEGIKIYSWGTLNQDMALISSGCKEVVFWDKKFSSGDNFEVVLETNCCLGENLYEIQAAVSYEESPDYLNQRILHWRDEAAFFQVLIKRDEYFFGGVIDMQMRAVF